MAWLNCQRTAIRDVYDGNWGDELSFQTPLINDFRICHIDLREDRDYALVYCNRDTLNILMSILGTENDAIIGDRLRLGHLFNYVYHETADGKPKF